MSQKLICDACEVMGDRNSYVPLHKLFRLQLLLKGLLSKIYEIQAKF